MGQGDVVRESGGGHRPWTDDRIVCSLGIRGKGWWPINPPARFVADRSGGCWQESVE